MANKTFVITDATSGAGKALALALAKTGETVMMIAPEEERGNAVLKEVETAAPNSDVRLELCDLSILSSVRNLSEILKSKLEKINVLINNASVQRRKRKVTVDGFEETFAANYLGPFLLTNLLLEKLQAAVQADGSARIVNITAPSNAPLDFEDLQSEKNFSPTRALQAAGAANLLFTLELAHRLENTGITVNAVDPGPAPGGLFGWLTSRAPTQASKSLMQAITAAQYEKMTGQFLQDGKQADLPAYARDRDAQQRLWKISEDLTQLTITKGVTPVNDPHLK